MDRPHDLGGMSGFGPVMPEPYEPVFHARWEARTLAMVLAMGAWRKWTLDNSRFMRESLPVAEYRMMSYYQIWLAAFVSQMIEAGVINEEELFSGRAQGAPATPPLTADRVRGALSRGGPSSRDIDRQPVFQVGQRVRARREAPMSHTRLPGYARGRMGVVEQLHGNHVFPDANAHGYGENPQPLYGVRFKATDLWWGKSADPRHSVRLDLWEDYLEPVL
ncbi:MAG: nitrile hydratase subunit beta [Alphaproteobacteria bacterium]